jgi:predicted DNA-binding transcriptional regulator AlpA
MKSVMLNEIDRRFRPRLSSLPPGCLPLGLSRVQAAEYVGVSPTTFDLMVKEGSMPLARRIRSRKVWLRHEVDEFVLKLPIDGDSDCGDDPWSRVKV